MKTPKLWAKQLAAALGKELEDSKEILNFLGTVDAQTLAVASMKLPNKVWGNIVLLIWILSKLFRN